LSPAIDESFVRDDRESALRVDVTSYKGVVQLAGFANSREEAGRAGDVARTIPGVTELKNDIYLK